MKLHQPLLLLLFILAQVAGYSQGAQAIQISLLNPACGCSGRVKVTIGQEAILPLTVTLSDGSGAIRVFHGVTSSLELDSLCKGNWKVSASPEKVEHCTVVEELVQVPEERMATCEKQDQEPLGKMHKTYCKGV